MSTGADDCRRAEDSPSPSRLWVCWTTPATLGDHDLVLSFLPPTAEGKLEQRYPTVRLLRAREESVSVRRPARAVYVELVARMGVARGPGGQSLRQALARPGEASRWWYHSVGFKDSEGEPTFAQIIAVLTIRAVAERHGVHELILVGGACEVAEALGSRFGIAERDGSRSRPALAQWLRGLGSRAKLSLVLLRDWVRVRRHTHPPSRQFDVVFFGFWDWSVSWDERQLAFADTYFKSVPDELKRDGVASVGWFAWFSPDSQPGTDGRRAADVLGPLQGKDEVVLLQAFLRPGEVLRALADVRPLRTFLRFRNNSTFRDVFKCEGIDYWPLFREHLLRGFLSGGLAHFELVASAVERACRRYQPRATLSFLEHYPHARACYEGVRRAGRNTVRLCIQHASYNHEKTFILLHPDIEFRGEPDGCAVPHADFVFPMGTLGRDLFLECGYSPDAVRLTGSPRYDHIRMLAERPVERWGPIRNPVTVLIAGGLDVNQNVEMLEAICAATEHNPAIRVKLRCHPFGRLDRHPVFARYREYIQVTNRPLEEDLSEADLVLFTYTGVAEEAFLTGKPVWQWLPLGFNGSALAETWRIPQFGSVASLREALREFAANPATFLPDGAARQAVLERLFYRGDGGAARRVSSAVMELIGTPAISTHTDPGEPVRVSPES